MPRKCIFTNAAPYGAKQSKGTSAAEVRSAKRSSQSFHCLDQITCDPHSSNFATGSGALNDQRIRAVSPGIETYQVIATFQAGNRRASVHHLQANLHFRFGDVD